MTLLLFLCSSFAGARADSHVPIKLADMIEASGLVLRVEATSIDEAAYDFATKEAFTKVGLTVLEVLSGETSDKTISLMLRGGLLPDGNHQVWSVVPELVVGETYIVFLRDGDYVITPFVTADVYREKRVDGQDVLVDQDGLLVDLSSEIPAKGPKLASGTRLLRDHQREGRTGRASDNGAPQTQKTTQQTQLQRRSLPFTAKQSLAKIRELCAVKNSKKMPGQKSAAARAATSSTTTPLQVRPSKFSPKLSPN